MPEPTPTRLRVSIILNMLEYESDKTAQNKIESKDDAAIDTRQPNVQREIIVQDENSSLSLNCQLTKTEGLAETASPSLIRMGTTK